MAYLFTMFQQIFPTSFCLYLRILGAADSKQQQLKVPIDILGKIDGEHLVWCKNRFNT